MKCIHIWYNICTCVVYTCIQIDGNMQIYIHCTHIGYAYVHVNIICTLHTYIYIYLYRCIYIYINILMYMYITHGVHYVYI